MEEYLGSNNKLISSSYLFATLQNLKTKYIDTKANKTDIVTYSDATESNHGLMAAEMVTKLNNISIVYEDTDLDLDF